MTTDVGRGPETEEIRSPGPKIDSKNGPRFEETESSRNSLAGAGWTCEKIGTFGGYVVSGSRTLSWINPGPLWRSRNQILGDYLGDPTNDERREWMRIQRAAGKTRENPTIRTHVGLEEVSFLVLGDPGEGDASQFAVVPPLLERGKGTHFMVICSDVIYPSGDVDEYEAKFYRPYEDYRAPIYALPGNHDWYDGLHGFMFHMCEAEARTPGGEVLALKGTGPWWKDPVRRLLWRKPKKVDATQKARRKIWRSRPEQDSEQRTPYFAIETGPVLLVGIDTGMRGSLDRDQGEWLERVSRESPKPKVLLTGKPIYVDNEYQPCKIEGGGTVDDIVRDPGHKYVAVIGGDIHNYQRYSAKVRGGDERLHYFVSGGGGAYMSATHKIPKITLPGVGEDDFVCYPRRGDSLSFYSKLYDRKFGGGKGLLEISPDEAAAYMAQRLGIVPKRGGRENLYIGKRTRWIADRILPLPDRGRGLLHHFFSEFFDWNDPPLFKNFLRVDASRDELTVRCFAATGCLEHEENPPVEDEVCIDLKPYNEGSRRS